MQLVIQQDIFHKHMSEKKPVKRPRGRPKKTTQKRTTARKPKATKKTQECCDKKECCMTKFCFCTFLSNVWKALKSPFTR